MSCHSHCHPPMSEKSHGHDISPSGVVTIAVAKGVEKERKMGKGKCMKEEGWVKVEVIC